MLATCLENEVVIYGLNEEIFGTFGECEQSSVIAFSRDGRKLAIGNKTLISIYDTLNGDALGNLRAHSAPIAEIAFSADGTMLASFGQGGELFVWSIEEPYRKLLSLTGMTGGLQELTFSLDVNHLFAVEGLFAAAGSKIRIWQLSNGDQQNYLDPGSVGAITLTNDGQIMLLGGGNGDLAVWDWQSRELLIEIPAHVGRVDGYDPNRGSYWYQLPIRDLQLIKEGQALLSLAADGTVKLWGIED